jgi:uncharacterized membrane protein
MRRCQSTTYHDRTEDAVQKTVLTAVGLLLTIAGVIFTLQGIGLIKGSSMTGTTLWTVLGPIIAVVGLGLAVTAGRAH